MKKSLIISRQNLGLSEDAVQEAFIEAAKHLFTKRKPFNDRPEKGDEGQILAWLNSTVRKKTLSLMRKPHNRIRHFDSSRIGSEMTSEVGEMEEGLDMDWIYNEVLKPRQIKIWKSAITQDGLTRKAKADLLEIKPGNFRNGLYQTKETLTGYIAAHRAFDKDLDSKVKIDIKSLADRLGLTSKTLKEYFNIWVRYQGSHFR